MLDTFGKFAYNIDINGDVAADVTNPISIGLPTTQGAAGGVFTATDIFKFLSNFGAVKTISQPQITVLSGSEARLRAANTENYVAQIAETIDNGQSTTSVSTSSVDTGFTITIGSAWDNATVYANIEILLSDVSEIEDFDFTSSGGGSTTVQLPKTTEREVSTQVRIRPGDSLLIAGLVREADNFSSSGPGFMKPVIPTSRNTTAENLELVFLLRPRVIVYTSPDEDDYYGTVRGSAAKPPAGKPLDYDFAPFKADATRATDVAIPPVSGSHQYDATTHDNMAPIGSVPQDLLNPAAMPTN
jgi:type II secretory pathway component GspD/PulD (secretin)